MSLTAAIESHALHCCFSPDGNKLAVTESNGNILVRAWGWACTHADACRMQSDARTHVVAHYATRACRACVGCILTLTSTAPRPLHTQVWNAIAGCQWYQIHGAHKGKVTACSWSYDCRRFVTAGADSTMAVSTFGRSLNFKFERVARP